MTQRMMNLLPGRSRSYRTAGYEDDDDLEASDEECAAFLAATAPNRLPQNLDNPVLTLGSRPLPPRPCSRCPHRDHTPPDNRISLLRRRSGRDQHLLDLLQEIMLTPRRYSDFDFYAALIPGLVSPRRVGSVEDEGVACRDRERL